MLTITARLLYVILCQQLRATIDTSEEFEVVQLIKIPKFKGKLESEFFDSASSSKVCRDVISLAVSGDA